MSLFESFKDGVSVLSPTNLKRLGSARLSDLVERDAERAKKKLDDLTQRYPSAGPRERQRTRTLPNVMAAGARPVQPQDSQIVRRLGHRRHEL